MKRHISRIMFCGLVIALMLPASAGASASKRFLVGGDGTITVQRDGGAKQTITYRNGSGDYETAGLQSINRLWGVNGDETEEQIELRLIEVLDHVQEHFHDRPIVLLSGFRSRKYNNSLRDNGKMAAQSSMHTEGGAADLYLAGVASADVAAFARGLSCCGVGYYHGRSVHLDTGPIRWWDEKTSGTGSKKPQRNEKIILSTDYDIYKIGQPIGLRFMRVTEFPVVIPQRFSLECQKGEEWKKVAPLPVRFGPPFLGYRNCANLVNTTQLRAGQAMVPAVKQRKCRSPEGEERYRVRVEFCELVAPEMPSTIVSNTFKIGS